MTVEREKSLNGIEEWTKLLSHYKLSVIHIEGIGNCLATHSMIQVVAKKSTRYMLCIEMGWYTTNTDERHVYSLIPINRLDMLVYPTSLFQILGGLMPYLRYLCLLAHSGVQRIY
jgi:hypothetical protein